ncbi:MAG: outer membrane lipoprotein-sorting protein [Bacteroidetes bacterium]|nr:MAG: outer membrane lipoprotein-sorting protein [Bacteroidota bacterium]RLD83135.1 MAG: outer membrane lipoprotein-sorting protein [Bacteroidota bacterium]
MHKRVLILTTVLFFSVFISAQNATDIIKKANDKERGITNKGTMTMTIVRPTWSRTVKFKTWGKGREYSMTLITYPAKEKGQTFLKRKNELWNWNPTISRMIKLPPSMMSQGWMGSDYTNDDILKESSIVVDYNHKIIGSEKVSGYDCYKIEMMPKEEAVVVWGKLIKWVSKKDYLQLKSVYYDEDGYVIKTEIGKDVKKMGGRLLPTTIEILPEDEPGHKTLVIINSVEFDMPMKETFFSQQNMKRLR